MSESERLRRLLGVLLPDLSRAGRRLVDHPQVRDMYPEYLVHMHWIVRASVPLMEAGRARASTIAASDPTAATAIPTRTKVSIGSKMDRFSRVSTKLDALNPTMRYHSDQAARDAVRALISKPPASASPSY